ncbi:hypothetical protein ZIOFF_000707 [Zingiber officinale]|uniref:ATPase AAA-type core domain-containing protein n=1 Tax=Zingiber officinale TaxID=94328 RepID=A0A8J5II58_ZINOF|nr:hypothetical protein ZIOFF_000707 [Zingiber officinale]
MRDRIVECGLREPQEQNLLSNPNLSEEKRMVARIPQCAGRSAISSLLALPIAARAGLLVPASHGDGIGPTTAGEGEPTFVLVLEIASPRVERSLLLRSFAKSGVTALKISGTVMMASSDGNAGFMIDMLKECGLSHKSIIFVLDEFDLFAQGKQRLLYSLLDAMQTMTSQAIVIGVSYRLDAD